MRIMVFQINAISSHSSSSLPSLKKISKENAAANPTLLHITTRRTIRSSADSSSSSGRWEQFLKQIPSPIPRLSDIFWPSAGGFAAMAVLGRIDQFVAWKGISFTIAPVGAVCAVLFAAPSSPAAQKYNMFVAQIGCAAIGVMALSIFGPGWLARATALAASIAFMTVTGSVHPPDSTNRTAPPPPLSFPQVFYAFFYIITCINNQNVIMCLNTSMCFVRAAAASLPILFIDSAKFHHLSLWYALFPGATGCLLICLIQEMVTFLKSNYRF